MPHTSEVARPAAVTQYASKPTPKAGDPCAVANTCSHMGTRVVKSLRLPNAVITIENNPNNESTAMMPTPAIRTTTTSLVGLFVRPVRPSTRTAEATARQASPWTVRRSWPRSAATLTSRRRARDCRADQGRHPRSSVATTAMFSASMTIQTVDASTLLAAIFGFLPHDDERLHAACSRSPTSSPRTVRAALPHRRDR